jgi:hypothetical protein
MGLEIRNQPFRSIINFLLMNKQTKEQKSINLAKKVPEQTVV